MESLLASASFPLLFIFACSFDFALGGLVEYMRGPQHTMLFLVTDRDYLWRHLISIYFIFWANYPLGFVVSWMRFRWRLACVSQDCLCWRGIYLLGFHFDTTSLFRSSSTFQFYRDTILPHGEAFTCREYCSGKCQPWLRTVCLYFGFPYMLAIGHFARV